MATITHKSNPSDNEQWFLRGPVGRNKLAGLMKTMADKADLPELSNGKRITNTSARKTLCQKLLDHNIPDAQAVHITGHKNVSSLNNYRQLTNKQQMCISNILSKSNANLTSMSEASILSQTSTAFISTEAQISGSEEVPCRTFSSPDLLKGMFAHASISGGTFNFYFK